MLTQQPQPAAAQRRANRNLLTTRGGAGNEQIGDVEAGNEQNAAGCGEKDIERPLHVADYRFEKGFGIRLFADEGQVEMLIVYAARDEREIRHTLCLGYAGLEASDDDEFVIVDSLHRIGVLFVVDRCHSCTPWSGRANQAGMTPITVYGFAASRIVCPRMEGLPP